MIIDFIMKYNVFINLASYIAFLVIMASDSKKASFSKVIFIVFIPVITIGFAMVVTLAASTFKVTGYLGVFK